MKNYKSKFGVQMGKTLSSRENISTRMAALSARRREESLYRFMQNADGSGFEFLGTGLAVGITS